MGGYRRIVLTCSGALLALGTLSACGGGSEPAKPDATQSSSATSAATAFPPSATFVASSAAAPNLRAGSARIRSRADQPGRRLRYSAGHGRPLRIGDQYRARQRSRRPRNRKAQPARSNANTGDNFVSGRSAGIRSVQMRIVLTTWQR